MSENNRVPLILFSGGLDSSYLLEQKLKEGHVETLYVSGAQDRNKKTKELEARQKIIRRLELRTGNSVICDHQIDIGVDIFGGMADKAFAQPAMWITGALQVSDARRHTELLIGYVAGDQISSKIPYIGQVWENLQSFSKNSGMIPVRFPLEWYTKQHILKDIGPDIIQHVWICEAPVREDGRLKACNDCIPCRTIDAQLYTWKRTTGRDYWKWKLDEYRRWREDNPRLAALQQDSDERCLKLSELLTPLENQQG